MFSGSDGFRTAVAVAELRTNWLAANPSAQVTRMDASAEDFSLQVLNEKLAASLFSPHSLVVLDDDSSFKPDQVSCPEGSLLLVLGVHPARKRSWSAAGANAHSFALPTYRTASERVSWSLAHFKVSADSEVVKALGALAKDDLPAVDSLIRSASILGIDRLNMSNLPAPLPPASEFYPSLTISALAAGDLPSALRTALLAEPNSFCTYLARCFAAALVPDAPGNLQSAASSLTRSGIDPHSGWVLSAQAVATAQTHGVAASVSLVARLHASRS